MPRVAVVVAIGLLAACVRPAPFTIERSTPTDLLIDRCKRADGPSCLIAGLRYLADAAADPPKRIGARQLLEHACAAGVAAGCHAAGLLAGPVAGVALHDRACGLGHQGGCERAEDLRGRPPRDCASALVLPGGKVVPWSHDHPPPEPISGGSVLLPPEAALSGLTGAVRACLWITPNGAVARVELLEDAPIFGEAVRAAVRAWRFPSFRWRGRPATARLARRFTFPRR